MAGVLTEVRGTRGTATGAGRAPAARPIGTWAFFAVALASLGGPLTLAALSGPGLLDGAGGSAGLVGLAGLVVGLLPLAVWLRFATRVPGPAGLTGFVEAAAGRSAALAHAAIWTFSYLLYLVYTTVQIAYDLLPVVAPGASGLQTVLAIVIPVSLIAVMLAGRTATLLVVGAIAAGQIALTGWLDVVSLTHLSPPVAGFARSGPVGATARAGVQVSLLYVCGSLPLFLIGELAAPRRTTTRVLPAAVAMTGLLVVGAMAPLAAAPGLARTALPGMTVMAQFQSAGAARAIGIGVMVSVAGVMACEYLALSRLAAALWTWRPRAIAAAIGAVMLAATPLILADPQGTYDTLLEPSLVALWLSQLVVFACYPRFARRAGLRVGPARMLSLAACAWALYALWLAVTATAS